MNKIKEIWRIIWRGNEVEIVMCSCLVLLLLSLSISLYFSEKITCLEKYKEYQPEFGFWTDCLIRIDGKLTPPSLVKIIK